FLIPPVLDLEPHLSLASQNVAPDDVLLLISPKKKSKMPELLSRLSSRSLRRKSLTSAQSAALTNSLSSSGGSSVSNSPSSVPSPALSEKRKRGSHTKQPVFGVSISI